MKKPHTRAGVLFFSLISLVISGSSCQTSSEKKEVAEGTTPGADSSMVSDPTPTMYLYELSIPADTLFKTDSDKNQDIVFQYYFSESTITLHGWRLKFQKPNPGQEQFNQKGPDVKLIAGKKSQVAIEPGTYLGNQVLWSKYVKKLYKDVAGKQATLYFTPKKDAQSPTIHYEVSVVVKEKGIDIKLDDTYNTNPSPPHQSFDN